MAADYCYRTAVTRLRCSDRDQQLLSETTEEWLKGRQMATDVAWNGCYDKRRLQSLVYEQLRRETGLKSQHAQLAIHRAAEAVRSSVERRRNGEKASKPEFSSHTIAYDNRTMTIRDDRTITLATVGPRVRVTPVLPSDEDGFQQQFLDDDAWELTESTLHRRNGSFFLHLGFRRLAPATNEMSEPQTVIGVDLGIENLAVTSTARFFSGRELRHRRSEFNRTRQGLDRNGSRSANRTLRELANREERHVNDVLHRVARSIVEEARNHECDVVALEELEGIRERLDADEVHFIWAFRRLQTYLEYKAQDRRILTCKVAPEYTSLRCAECGHTESANRPARTMFNCQSCGSQANADYNAAKNIAEKCIRSDQQSSERMGVSRYALKSGVIDLEEGFLVD